MKSNTRCGSLSHFSESGGRTESKIRDPEYREVRSAGRNFRPDVKDYRQDFRERRFTGGIEHGRDAVT